MKFRNFFDDDMTRQALNSSEVFQNYIEIELDRERQEKAAIAKELEKKAAEEGRVLDAMEKFREYVNSAPAFKARLKQAKAMIEAHPEVASKVDPNFIRGLELLDLDGED